MKKIICFILCVVFSIPLTVSADELMDITRAAGYEVSEINRPRSTIVIDGNTGDVIWQDNADELRDPASMSKVMTLFLVYEAIAQGRLSEDTIIRATATDQAIAEIYEISNNKIVAGVDYTVGELITMTAVPSSNVTTVMLANYLSNHDPDAFLDVMNAKAKELGMTNTIWYNASGAAAASFKGFYQPLRYDNWLANQTTARDMAILTYHFLKLYPAILSHTNQPTVTVKSGTPYEETFKTYNYSLPGAKYGIDGVDGLKTGSSPRGAFNYIATVKRGEQRLIAVIMGVGNWSDQNGEYYRHPFGNALIEKAYADYEYKKLLTAGKQTINGKEYQLEKDLYATLAKGAEPQFVVENNQVRVDNGLESVSPLIQDTVPVQESGIAATLSSVFQTEKEEEKTSVSAQPSLFASFGEWGMYVLIFLPILGLVCLVVCIERRNRKQHQERREQRSRRRRQP